ncbi:MAG TPA: zf-HC2 domain-containing protein [Bryobacteraceae bacterium]|nr:zf-HC2 domain-containing protein [Bryobacteraceae bacterium]
MRHGISEQKWVEFLDGALRADEAAAIRAHLRDCPACRQLASELSRWRELLAEEGRRLRAALGGPEADLDAMLRRCLARIRRSGTPERADARWTLTEALAVLRFLMEPFCGPGTVRAVVDRAVARSAATGRMLTWNDWGRFVGNLSETTSAVCGSAVGRLVERAGLSLAPEALT